MVFSLISWEDKHRVASYCSCPRGCHPSSVSGFLIFLPCFISLPRSVLLKHGASVHPLPPATLQRVSRAFCPQQWPLAQARWPSHLTAVEREAEEVVSCFLRMEMSTSLFKSHHLSALESRTTVFLLVSWREPDGRRIADAVSYVAQYR